MSMRAPIEAVKRGLRIGKRRDTATHMVDEDRSEVARLWTGMSRGKDDRIPAPIASVSVGTAGLKRARKWLNAMYAAGCGDRVQSVVLYDCNRTSIERWEQTQSERTAAIAVMPRYLPMSEGFLRNHAAFQEHRVPIERDLEMMVERMTDLSHEAGTYPQLIIEWVGFGGHAQLSYLLHDIVQKQFPNATYLPIFCLPDERVLERSMREVIWEQAMEAHGGRMSLLTDNAMTNDVEMLDSRLAIALAAVESAYKASPEVGTLAETAGMLGMQKAAWLGVAEQHIPIRVDDGKLIMGRDESTLHDIKAMIWDMAGRKGHNFTLAEHSPHDRHAEQRIYVSVPISRDDIMNLRTDLLDQLRREDFEAAYPATKVQFAPANYRFRERHNAVNAHVTKIFNAGNEPQPSLERILQEDYVIARRNRNWIQTRGQSVIDAEENDQREPDLDTVALNGASAGHDGAGAEGTARSLETAYERDRG